MFIVGGAPQLGSWVPSQKVFTPHASRLRACSHNCRGFTHVEQTTEIVSSLNELTRTMRVCPVTVQKGTFNLLGVRSFASKAPEHSEKGLMLCCEKKLYRF